MMRDVFLTDLFCDGDFIMSCYRYGLNLFESKVGKDLILIITPIEDLYVIFDKKYNTIGIEKNTYLTEEEFAEKFYQTYSDPSNKFIYPFKNYSLKDFIEIGNRISIVETKYSNSFQILIDGKNYYSKFEVEYFQLLSYIKFISEKIKTFFITNYHMQAIGFNCPDVYSYINSIINNINECVNLNMEKNIRTFPKDILYKIGQANMNDDDMLYDIIALLDQKKDLETISNELLEILNTNYENKENQLKHVKKLDY